MSASRFSRPIHAGLTVVAVLLSSVLSPTGALSAPPAATGTGTGGVPPANNPANPLNPISPANPGNTSANARSTDPGSPSTNPAAGQPAAIAAAASDGSEKGERTPPKSARVLTLSAFVAQVLRANLDLAAQRFNVPIAKAQLAAARVSPNPVLNLGTGRDLTHEDQPTTYFAGVTQQIELPGKRASRTSAAARSLLAASATLEDYLRTLRGNAASAYVDAVSGQLILAEKQRAFTSLNQLADANDVRFKAGDIDEADADQARADALQARGDLYSSESSNRANQYALLGLLGKAGAPLPQTVNNLDIRVRPTNLTALLVAALRRRPDIVAARDTRDAARASARLARLNRVPDPTFGVTLQQSLTSQNPIDPTPNFNSVNLSISLPLPVFNGLRGEYLAAVNTAAQAEQNLRSAELKAEVDLRGAYARCQTAALRLTQYQNGALDLASKVLQARLLSYKAGSATLLDVLQAQKADTDVHLAYIDALTERAKAIIALEQAADLWDIEF